jgi:hypothetical protein
MKATAAMPIAAPATAMPSQGSLKRSPSEPRRARTSIADAPADRVFFRGD